jgi:poly(3-hydroxybutyrate) depolymerase
MLYSLYEAQHMALVPLRFLAELTRGWFGHPFSPFAHHPLSRRFAASSDLFLRVTDRYEKPTGTWRKPNREVVLEQPFCKLIRFRLGARSRARCWSWRRFPATTPRWCATRCARSSPSTTCW